jgi:hypothetical protein
MKIPLFNFFRFASEREGHVQVIEEGDSSRMPKLYSLHGYFSHSTVYGKLSLSLLLIKAQTYWDTIHLSPISTRI